MNAEQVVTKILSDANAEAEKIKAQASEKIQQSQTDLKAELVSFDKETEILTAEAAEDKRARILAAARMEIKKEKLQAKRSILDDAFVKAAEKIKTMDDGQYTELMEKLIKKATVTGDEEVLVDKDDKRINNDLLKRINRSMPSGAKGDLKLASETVDIQAGFILRRGKIKMNVSLSVLLHQVREELEGQLANELFG